VAISICGKADRLNPARVSGPCNRSRRKSSTSNFEKLHRLLSSDPNPFGALEGRARAESQAAAGFGIGDRNRRSGRIASPVRASGSLIKSLKMQSRRTFGEPQFI